MFRIKELLKCASLKEWKMILNGKVLIIKIGGTTAINRFNLPIVLAITSRTSADVGVKSKICTGRLLLCFRITVIPSPCAAVLESRA